MGSGYSRKQLRNIGVLVAAIVIISSSLIAAGFQWSPLPVLGIVGLLAVARLIDMRGVRAPRVARATQVRRSAAH